VATVAERVAADLRAAGIELVFGLPGGENVELLDALRRAGLRFLLTYHESADVFMADAAARLTTTPGVCLTTLGPGAANAIAGARFGRGVPFAARSSQLTASAPSTPCS